MAGKIAAVVLPMIMLAAASLALVRPGVIPGTSKPRPHYSLQSTGKVRYFGVSVPAPISANLTAFEEKAGTKAGIVAYYRRFGSPFRDSPAVMLRNRGATPLLQWNPTGVSLKAIATGQYDVYLREYARDIRNYPAHLVISFGHEMNGPWWSWGSGHQSAASFVAAWRHIHDTFDLAGVDNVTWLWNVNVLSRKGQAFGPWWPGGHYVDWIGLDGYYWNPGQTFSSVFDETLRSIHKLAPNKPVLICETGVYPDKHMANQITDLFSGAASAHLLGVVYFNYNGHADWRIPRGTTASTALRKAAHQFVQ